MPALTFADAPGLTISEPSSFAGSQLYGVINGGAELYLEYGFERLTRWLVSGLQGSLLVSLYQMTSPAAAFGIYSLSAGACDESPGSTGRVCPSAHRLLLCRGAHVLEIVHYGGDEAAQRQARSIAEAMLSRLPAKDFSAPPLLLSPALAHAAAHLRYVKGPVALSSAAPEWQPRLAGVDRFDLFLTRTTHDNVPVHVAQLCLENPAAAARLARNLGIDPSQKRARTRSMEVLKTGPTQLLFVESISQQGRDAIVKALK